MSIDPNTRRIHYSYEDPITQPIRIVTQPHNHEMIAAEVPRPRTTGDHKKEGIPTWAKITAAVGAAAVTMGVGAKVVFGGGESAPTTLDRPVATSTELPPLDMYQTDIRHSDFARQLDVTVPFLEQHRQESLEAIKDKLPNPDELTGEKKEMQILLNNFSADIRTASTQENTVLGRNLLASLYTETAPSKWSIGEQIGDGGGVITQRRAIDAVSNSYSGGIIHLDQ